MVFREYSGLEVGYIPEVPNYPRKLPGHEMAELQHPALRILCFRDQLMFASGVSSVPRPQYAVIARPT